jgi:hypothetical protein
MWSIERWLNQKDSEQVVDRIIDMCLTRWEETMLLLEEVEPASRARYTERMTQLKQSIVQMQFSASKYMEHYSVHQIQNLS